MLSFPQTQRFQPQGYPDDTIKNDEQRCVEYQRKTVELQLLKIWTCSPYKMQSAIEFSVGYSRFPGESGGTWREGRFHCIAPVPRNGATAQPSEN